MQSIELERTQEEDDETHQIRSLGRSGQCQLPQGGSLDVSLYSGAFTSSADCVVRIIKFWVSEGNNACYLLQTSFWDWNPFHCGLYKKVSWIHGLQSHSIHLFNLNVFPSIVSFRKSGYKSFPAFLIKYCSLFPTYLPLDLAQKNREDGTNVERIPNCHSRLSHVWTQTYEMQPTPCGEKWAQLSLAPNADP